MKEDLPQYQTEIGADTNDIKQVAVDLANLPAVNDYFEPVDAAKITTNQIKNAVFNGDPNAPLAIVPTIGGFTVPFPPMKPGCLDRFQRLARRFKAAAGYTKEIGITLGIDEAGGDSVSSDTLTAALAVRDLGSYQLEASFKKQGMSAMLIQYRPKGTEKWLELKTALQSLVVANVPPPDAEGAALQLEIRARLLDGNQQVGQWSPIYPVTVNP
jgi:hypothetical protein